MDSFVVFHLTLTAFDLVQITEALCVSIFLVLKMALIKITSENCCMGDIRKCYIKKVNYNAQELDPHHIRCLLSACLPPSFTPAALLPSLPPSSLLLLSHTST